MKQSRNNSLNNLTHIINIQNDLQGKETEVQSKSQLRRHPVLLLKQAVKLNQILFAQSQWDWLHDSDKQLTDNKKK